MAHMMTCMTRMTRSLDSHDSLARWLAVCQDPLVNRYFLQPIVSHAGECHVCVVLFLLKFYQRNLNREIAIYTFTNYKLGLTWKTR